MPYYYGEFRNVMTTTCGDHNLRKLFALHFQRASDVIAPQASKTSVKTCIPAGPDCVGGSRFYLRVGSVLDKLLGRPFFTPFASGQMGQQRRRWTSRSCFAPALPSMFIDQLTTAWEKKDPEETKKKKRKRVHHEKRVLSCTDLYCHPAGNLHPPNSSLG